MDIRSVYQKVDLWKTLMPRVEMFYAVKVNADKKILKVCLQKGLGFDAGSESEFKKMISLGVDPKKIFYGNPIKSSDSILEAKKCGVKMMSFDCESELLKVKIYYPEAELVLRVYTCGANASEDAYHDKHGAPMDDVT